MRLAFLLFAVGLVACGPEVASPSGAQSTTGSSDPSTGVPGTSSGGDTSVGDSTSSTSNSTSPTTSGSSTGDLGEGEACSDIAQDCAAGLKCIRIDLDGDFDDERICVPVVGDGEDGAPCTRDPRTGIDSCSAITFCTPGPAEPSEGTCVEFCSSDFTCASADDICVGSSSQGEYGCFPSCNPLSPRCGPAEYCIGAYPTQGFVCVPRLPDADATTGEACLAPLEGCTGSLCYQCASGYGCLDVREYGPGCADPQEESCCTEYCALIDGTCSNPLHVCRDLPSEYVGGSLEGVGLCGLPEDYDWCTDAPDEAPAGLCPPENLDPNVPWCSTLNTEACTEDHISLAGGCWCLQSCEDASTCPVPETGTPEVACEPDFGCTLLCDGDEDCPDGMDCHFGFGELRCWWNPDAP